MIPLEEGDSNNLSSSFVLYFYLKKKNPKEKDFVSTELKQYVDVSSKPKSSFNSYFSSISSLQI